MGSQRPGLLRYCADGVLLFAWALLVLSLRLNLGPIGIPPDLHGFYKWAMDTLAILNEFVLKVVHHRQTFSFASLVQLDLCPSGSISGLQAPRFPQWVWYLGPASSDLMPTFVRHDALLSS